MNLKKIMIILLIVILTIIVSILFIITSLKEQDVKENEEIYNIGDPPTEIYVEEKLKKLNSENDFFNLESIIQNFYLYSKVSNANIVYNILDIDYLEENNIFENNVLDKIKDSINIESQFNMKQIYVRDHASKPIYYCYGEENLNNEKREVYFKVYKDLTNSTYSISIITNDKYKEFIAEKIVEKNEKEIEENKFNKIKIKYFSEEEIVTKYFEDFIYTEATDIKKAYNLLNKEYSEKRFKSISDYEEYVNRNKDKIESLNAKGMKTYEDFNNVEEFSEYLTNLAPRGLSSYKINIGDNPKIIACTDYYGYYYVFNIYSAMEYDVILDQHTIDSETTIQKYTEASNENKVLINIEKIRDAINTDDYNYIYEKLDNTFKKNNYPTLNSFIKFMDENLYDNNKFIYSDVNEQNGIYIVVLKVSDAQEKDSDIKKLNVVMRLEENRNFTMSFSI